MPRRQQFRAHAEYCLRLAELINSPEQKVSLNATANAWHRFAQELDLRGESIRPQDRDRVVEVKALGHIRGHIWRLREMRRAHRPETPEGVANSCDVHT
jgi:hypothetical protein